MSIRIGVIGTGWIGRQHIHRLANAISGASVVAVADIDPESAAEAAAAAGARVLSAADDLISDAKVDAVVVTSWGPAHAEQVLACIAAGKPVFCEKPLTTDAADGMRILKAEQAHGKRLVQVGFMRRYDAGYRQMKQIIDAGEIGTPLIAHCAHRNPTVGDSYSTDMAAKDTAVHEVDTLRWLLDDEFVSVQAVLPRATAKRFEHLKDPQIFLFETASGARVDVEVFVNCQFGYDIQCEVVGEEGTVRLPDPAAPQVRRAGRASTTLTYEFADRFAAAFDVELQDWLDRLRAGEDPTGPNAWDGYAATVAVDAAARAIHSGAVETIDLPVRPAFYAQEGADR